MEKKLVSIVSSAAIFGTLLIPSLSSAEISQNRIINPGLETENASNTASPDRWEQGFWGENDAVFSYPVAGAGSERAAKIEISAYSSGDAKWYFNDVAVSPRERYVFSDHYFSDVPSDVVARYTLENGDYKYAYLGTAVVSSEWTGYSTSPFNVPPGAVSVTIFHLIRSTGALSIDNASLVELPEEKRVDPPGAVPLSYIKNSSSQIPPPLSATQEATTTIPLMPSEDITQESSAAAPTVPIISSLVRSLDNTKISLAQFARAETANVTPSQSKAEEVSLISTEGEFEPPKPALSDLTVFFLGLSLLLASFGIPFLARQSNQEREEQMWEP